MQLGGASFYKSHTSATCKFGPFSPSQWGCDFERRNLINYSRAFWAVSSGSLHTWLGRSGRVGNFYRVASNLASNLQVAQCELGGASLNQVTNLNWTALDCGNTTQGTVVLDEDSFIAVINSRFLCLANLWDLLQDIVYLSKTSITAVGQLRHRALLCPQSSFHPSWLDGMICSTGSRLFQCRCRGEVDKGRLTYSCIAPFLLTRIP